MISEHKSIYRTREFLTFFTFVLTIVCEATYIYIKLKHLKKNVNRKGKWRSDYVGYLHLHINYTSSHVLNKLKDGRDKNVYHMIYTRKIIFLFLVG